MGAPQYEQAGADIGGSGTTNTIPRWTGPSTLGDSLLSQSGTIVSAASAFRVAAGTNWSTNDGGLLLFSNNGYKIGFDSVGSTVGYIRYQVDTAGSTLHGHMFSAGALGSPTNLMFIRSDGNVGIGTTSPQEKTQVFGNLKVGVYASGSFISLGDEGTTQKNVGIFRGASVNELQLGGYGGIIFTTGAAQLGSQTQRMQIDLNGNIYGTSGTTGMTNGFFYIPAAAGAPTGTPTAVSGRVPMYYDTTNNEFYVYNGAWKKVALA